MLLTKFFVSIHMFRAILQVKMWMLAKSFANNIFVDIFEWLLFYCMFPSSDLLLGYTENYMACRGIDRPCQTPKMESLAEIVNDLQPLTTFAKCSILYVWHDSEYVSDLVCVNVKIYPFFRCMIKYDQVTVVWKMFLKKSCCVMP